MSRLKIIGCLLAILVLCNCSKLCRSGYEGSECSVVARDKFEGTWSAVDSPGNLVYIDSIYNAPGIGDVLLSNAFASHYFVHTITASAVNQILTIAYQNPDGVAKYVEGSGQINNAGNMLSWTYQLTDSTQSPPLVTSYTGNWTR